VKLSDLSDEQWFSRLSGRRNANAQTIEALWKYYDNEQPLYHVAKILAEQDDRFPALTINWCRKYARSIDGRSNLEGFGYVGKDSIDDNMQRIMLRNEMDLHQSVNNIATLVTARSYGMVGPSTDGALITFESPDSVAVEVDPRSGEVIASLKFWSSDVEQGRDDLAVLQLPDSRGGSRLVDFELGKPVKSERQKWMAGPAKLQASGLIPVVPFLNRVRYGTPVSQLADLIPIVDAANFVATSMMATVVHHAAPRMLAINVLETLFMNEDGSINREAVKAATGSLWIVPAETDEEGNVPENAPEPDIKQLSASDLRNFHETLSLLARVGAGLCDLTPTDFGFGISDNPPSADSINASKHERLLGIERFNRQQGAGYERLMRYALAVEGRDPGKNLIEAKFRNPATPTKQSMADAAVKALSSGISDLYQARLDYGYTPTQIESMEKRERKLARDPFRIEPSGDDVTTSEQGDDGGDTPDASSDGE
jgi:hypothetical protein